MQPHEGQPVLTAGMPLGEGRAVMIMLHGRGAGPRDILSLAPALDRPEFTYLAPAAANNTWYPYSFLSDMSRNEPALSSALTTVAGLIDHVVAKGVNAQRIMLLGFSQGACLSCEVAVRHATRYGGVVAFSGGLIGPPGTAWNYGGAFDGTPIFLGCSDVDPHIPKERVDETAAVFTRMGAEVTKRIYPGMGHLVSDDEIAVAKTMMQKVLSE